MTSLPTLDAATESALRASIAKFGVLVPVLVDQHGKLEDGNNRRRIAAELGKPCPEFVVELPDDEEARREALADINDARRPRMSTAQRREVVIALRAEGHSTPAIARAVGVHDTTVLRDIHRATSAHAEVEFPDRIVGLDGRSYPAERPPVAIVHAVPEPETYMMSDGPRVAGERPFLERGPDGKTRVVPGPLRLRDGMKRSPRQSIDDVAERALAQLSSSARALGVVDWEAVSEEVRATHVAALEECKKQVQGAIRRLQRKGADAND